MLSRLLLLGIIMVMSNGALASDVFKGRKCDQVLHNRYYTTCYDYGHKGPRYTFYKLKGSLVDRNNIAHRFHFRQDRRIPVEYRVSDTDYAHNMRGLERGHMAPDADFDYSYAALRSTYLLSNAVPQDGYVNRYGWGKAEELERLLARTNKIVYVTNGVIYNDTVNMSMRGVSVPVGFWKYITNRRGLNICLLYANKKPLNGVSLPYRGHMVPCKTIEGGNIPGMNVE